MRQLIFIKLLSKANLQWVALWKKSFNNTEKLFNFMLRFIGFIEAIGFDLLNKINFPLQKLKL